MGSSAVAVLWRVAGIAEERLKVKAARILLGIHAHDTKGPPNG